MGQNKNNGFTAENNQNHAGYIPGLSEGAVWPPILTTTTYQANSARDLEKAFQVALSGKSLKNLIYSRVNHPNANILEDRLKYIEPQGKEAAVFSSGMAGIMTTILASCPKNKTIAYTNPLYGGTFHFLNGYLKPEMKYKLVELSVKTNIACKQLKKIGKNLGLLYLETPANPTLQMADIDALCTASKAANPASYAVLDNTFMGIFQHGFKISSCLDLILYSGTKFIGGHSDTLNGIVICRDTSLELMKRIKGLRIIFGNILHPFECSQILVHLHTYELRMSQLAQNARYIAHRLNDLHHKKLLTVMYPDLFPKGTSQYTIYKKQCSAGSSIICFKLKSGKAGAFRFLDELKKSGIVQLAVSLGGVESLASHPASTTHSEMSKAVLQRIGITNNLVRFSVGLENPADLIKVIKKALNKV